MFDRSQVKAGLLKATQLMALAWVTHWAKFFVVDPSSAANVKTAWLNHEPCATPHHRASVTPVVRMPRQVLRNIH
uniref:hypothetical protein n=1 Tax=Polaromonas sp. W11N TaxID=1840303 RepID=UPI0015E7F564|nr:hypothetical protein [Polaromonas sp. W11N]